VRGQRSGPRNPPTPRAPAAPPRPRVPPLGRLRELPLGLRAQDGPHRSSAVGPRSSSARGTTRPYANRGSHVTSTSTSPPRPSTMRNTS
jgi:hypothetical protein